MAFEKSRRISSRMSRFGVNPDHHLFKVVLTLNVTFTVLFLVGCSIPAWNFVEENVTNFNNCSSADSYVGELERRTWRAGQTAVVLTSSLWFVHVRIQNEDRVFSRLIPFAFLKQEQMPDKIGNGMTVEHVIPKCLTTLLIFVFLSLATVFMFCTSGHPSRLVYYGLTSVMMLSAISVWITVTLSSSEHQVLEATYELCIMEGSLKTSLLLQMITGCFGFIAFTLAGVLIHYAVVINSHIHAQYTELSEVDFDNYLSIADKVPMVYREPQFENYHYKVQHF